jgi:Tol biopolymer transport system component
VGNTYRIYRLPLAPTATVTLVVADAAQPQLAHDGRRLAFRDTRSHAPGISGFDLSAGLQPDERMIRYTTVPEDVTLSPPSWSIDGGRLVFASNREGDRRTRIYLKSATADDAAQLLAIGQDPVWRPLLGENLILFSGRDSSGEQPGLWLVNDRGTLILRLTDNERDRRPAWSPDAKEIVFMSDGRDNNWEIYRVSVASGVIQRLTTSPAQDGLPTISPDGKFVAYASDKGGQWHLWIVPLDGSKPPARLAPIEGELTSWLEHAVQWVEN